MKFLDSTVNQHYLSQVEQRLNACNPNALHSNQKIYSFEILKRGNSDEIKLGDPEGKKIKVNLALDDLFTFDVEPKANLRQNLEALFQRYEQNVHICTESLLKKIEAKSGDISEDLISLFSAKLLNFIRNPNSIPKILDTFRGIVNFRPTNPEHDALFQAVLHGRKPQQYARCKELQISDIQYREWLGMLFMLLNPLGRGSLGVWTGIGRLLGKALVGNKFFRRRAKANEDNGQQQSRGKTEETCLVHLLKSHYRQGCPRQQLPPPCRFP